MPNLSCYVNTSCDILFKNKLLVLPLSSRIVQFTAILDSALGGNLLELFISTFLVAQVGVQFFKNLGSKKPIF